MTGSDFVKKLKPIGCVIFLAMFVLVTAILFSSGRDPIKGYTAPHDSGYYQQSGETLEELQVELEKNVFPYLDGVVSCRSENGTLVVTIEENSFAATRGAILHYFDKDLFEFAQK